MKLLFTCLFFCFYSLLSGQNDTIRTEIDYFTWNNLSDSNVIYINQLNDEHRIIRIFPSQHSTKINWELIQLSSKKYLYLTYSDSSRIQKESGTLFLSTMIEQQFLIWIIFKCHFIHPTGQDEGIKAK